RAWRVPSSATFLGSALVAACVICWEAVGLRSLFQNLAGVGLVAGGLGLNARPGWVRDRLAVLGRCGYGIFLLHTLFIETAGSAAELAGLGRTVWLDLAIWVFAIAASIVTTMMAKRSAWTRWMLPT